MNVLFFYIYSTRARPIKAYLGVTDVSIRI